MLKAIKRALGVPHEEPHLPAQERRHLQLAVAVLLHEARRADYAEGESRETAAAELALRELFSLDSRAAAELLAHGREKAQQLNSFYAPLAAIKREFDMPERIRLLEHLWRVTFADGELNIYEDHYVRKIAHLLYVTNTENMVARNRARG